MLKNNYKSTRDRTSLFLKQMENRLDLLINLYSCHMVFFYNDIRDWKYCIATTFEQIYMVAHWPGNEDMNMSHQPDVSIIGVRFSICSVESLSSNGKNSFFSRRICTSLKKFRLQKKKSKFAGL